MGEGMGKIHLVEKRLSLQDCRLPALAERQCGLIQPENDCRNNLLRLKGGGAFEIIR